VGRRKETLRRSKVRVECGRDGIVEVRSRRSEVRGGNWNVGEVEC